MHVALLLIALLSSTGQKPPVVDKPAILIYWEAGMTLEPPPYVLEFAVWKSGRVIWRDKPHEYVKVGDKWHSTSGKHWEARVEQKEVAKALARLRTAGVFGLKDWNLLPPDASSRSIEVRDGAGSLRLTSAGEPGNAPPDSRDSVEYTKQLRAWRLVRELAKELTPTKGKTIPPPDVSKWWR